MRYIGEKIFHISFRAGSPTYEFPLAFRPQNAVVGWDLEYVSIPPGVFVVKDESGAVVPPNGTVLTKQTYTVEFNKPEKMWMGDIVILALGAV